MNLHPPEGNRTKSYVFATHRKSGRPIVTKLGGWWLSSLSLSASEVLLQKYPTNYFVEDKRPLGGRLYVTDRRLVFLPHVLDAWLGGDRISLYYEEIEEVASEADSLTDEEIDGRRIPIRLRVDTTDGRTHLFVLGDVDKAVEAVLDAIYHAAASDDEAA